MHLRRDARPIIRLIREEGLPRGANRVVYTTLTFLSPRDVRYSCLSRQLVQFKPCNGYRFLFKLIASSSKFVQQSVTANILNVVDKIISRLNHRELVSLAVAVVSSMSEKDVSLKLMFIAIILRT